MGTDKITFLLGAGASIPAGIPGVERFTEEFLEELGMRRDPTSLAMHAYLCRINAAWRELDMLRGRPQKPPHLEQLYALIHHLLGLDPPQGLPLELPTAFSEQIKTCRETELLSFELKKFVQSKVLNTSSLKFLQPITKFYRPESGLDFLTLNYDLCIERVLTKARIAWTDGFDHAMDASGALAAAPRFPASSAKPNPARILKLHGSASWYEVSPGRLRRVVANSSLGLLGRFREARTMAHEAGMIYPTLHKALGRGPFPRLMSLAQGILNSTRLLLVAGYRFGDSHILDLVLDALETNPRLQVVLMDPQPEGTFEVLVSKSPKHACRIGISSVEKCGDSYHFGFFQHALANNWLIKRSRAWIDGEELPTPRAAITARLRKTGLPWSPEVTPSGYSKISYLHRESPSAPLYFVAQDDSNWKSIFRWDIDTPPKPVRGSAAFRSPRGLATDPASQTLYVVENCYRGFSVPILGKLLDRAGNGRVWALNERTGKTSPLTKVKFLELAKNLARMSAHRRATIAGMVVAAEQCIPRWPTHVAIDSESSTEALLLEARRLSRLDLRTGKRSLALDLPLPFNLCGLWRMNPAEVLLVDAGVFPYGRGRLLLGNLRTREVKVLYEAEVALGSAIFLPDQQRILVTIARAWPRGEVRSFHWRNCALIDAGSWLGLDSPSSLAYAHVSTAVHVGTNQGIVRLTEIH